MSDESTTSKVFGEDVPQAESVRIFWCDGPECQRPHVVLFDEFLAPIASFVLPDPRPDGTSFATDLVEAQRESVMRRSARLS